MTRIALIIGSTRSPRRSDYVATWVEEAARRRLDGRGVVLDLVDVADFGLPVLDETHPAAYGLPYEHEHTRRWSRAIDSYDGFVFLTAEHNRGIPASLKNAIDYLYAEWADKAAGFVSFGASGGAHAVAHLRGVLSELKVHAVRAQVQLGSFTDFAVDAPSDLSDLGRMAVREHQEGALAGMLDEVVELAGALRRMREERTAPLTPVTATS
ncbi:NAD(P)H-dependent oxidoreductase [Nocardiopsis tropica]|uniref:NAD(P)H-dependent oxidoreductase n=1 Tax=Nocardiopsis tropica TaxID=109330 RepID=A0ABU7KIJ8_9ACTN|nr:NAD(P)H-dependent oxidoreductase [Nocardiopsis umidischolae]MEE2049121.1 NAD(P)H-dependent oxidoreductase [Nocardiopsis umidischolae]